MDFQIPELIFLSSMVLEQVIGKYYHFHGNGLCCPLAEMLRKSFFCNCMYICIPYATMTMYRYSY
jgi:hypothetical protein